MLISRPPKNYILLVSRCVSRYLRNSGIYLQDFLSCSRVASSWMSADDTGIRFPISYYYYYRHLLPTTVLWARRRRRPAENANAHPVPVFCGHDTQFHCWAITRVFNTGLFKYTVPRIIIFFLCAVVVVIGDNQIKSALNSITHSPLSNRPPTH